MNFRTYRIIIWSITILLAITTLIVFVYLASTYVNKYKNSWKTKCLNITDGYEYDKCVEKYKQLERDGDDVRGTYIFGALFVPLLLICFGKCYPKEQMCYETPEPPQIQNHLLIPFFLHQDETSTELVLHTQG